MLAYLHQSGPHLGYSIDVATARGRLTLAAALSATQVENVAFCLKSLPTHVLELSSLIFPVMVHTIALAKFVLEQPTNYQPKPRTPNPLWSNNSSK